jgi:hypothetical protein
MARPAITADEKDAFSRESRRNLIWRPGERKAIKSRYSRHDRRSTRRSLRAGQES